MERRKMERRRVRDSGIVSDIIKTGPKNKITGMPGVLVGHKTVRSGGSRTGVTVIAPRPGNVFDRKLTAVGYVHNGLGKACGPIQMEELGTLEIPIVLINTLNVDLAADVLTEYTVRQCAGEQVEVASVSPVVGEYDDCKISRIQCRVVSMEDVMETPSRADGDFKKDDVGAGTGTMYYGLKGGIGSASGIMRTGDKKYTLGVPVQSNFEVTEDLAISGIWTGKRILEKKERHRKMAATERNQRSIMTIVATDLSVSDRQLKHIIRRAGAGIARTGTCTGHGNGEVMIGFTTAGCLQGKDSSEIMISTYIREDLISVAFKAAAGAVYEAILDSMTAAGRTGGLAGETYYSLSEPLPQILRH